MSGPFPLVTSLNSQPEANATTREDAPALHTRRIAALDAEIARLEQLGNRYSLGRLLTFVAGAVLVTNAIVQRAAASAGAQLALGVVLLLTFGVAVVLHARNVTAQSRARVRRAVHARHLQRMTPAFATLPHDGDGLLPRGHAYARDIDLLGHASLFQRIDVTHTVAGAKLLAQWLGAAAEPEVIAARQAAVRELSARMDFREELEASAGDHGDSKLDASGLAVLAQLAPVIRTSAAWRATVIALPTITVSCALAATLGILPGSFWLLPGALQIVLLMRLAAPIRHAVDLVAAKLPVFEAFEQQLLLVEHSRFECAHLREVAARVSIGAVPPSAHLARIARWAGFAELRQNPIFHVIANTLVLWDAHVLWGIERFVHEVGERSHVWFEAIAELEALSSLATLAHGDPGATFPEIAPADAGLYARELAHPLLAPQARVANDLELRGPGSALVITGSNMAGKSTLLRAIGQNIALALAGGPVIAQAMRVPRVRLRASMRAEDSLESGASYFHAELQKLKMVVEHAEADPPVFFLLDELLRGTNARARHVGGKAVLLHLLERRATGLVATHDLELGALASEHPGRVDNVHFTDVVVAGEMRFDYKLRPGIVRTSNALRLLALAGIDVPERERSAELPSAALHAGSAIGEVR